ncbi:MAG: sensor histidine kinase [Phycisphaerales bacterium]
MRRGEALAVPSCVGVVESADAGALSPGLSPEELGELVSAFNGVAARLQRTQETLRGEVRRLESELSDSQRELKRARELAAIGEMAAGIAHEIRNPLGSMKLYARLLVSDLSDRPSERGTALKIVESVDRVNEIVTDVLGLARDLRVSIGEHDARAIIEDSVGACGAQVERAGMRVEVGDLGGGAGGSVIRCDGSLMRQVVSNVVRNACEAIGEWGDRPADRGVIGVSLDHRRVLCADGKRRGMDVIRVVDDGPGISAEAVERAFNPFYTTREAGTGLGLAIVHRVMDAHGGWARIFRNESGAGTVVELLLPSPGGDDGARGGGAVRDNTQSGASS